MIDLEEFLESSDTKLYGKYREIQKACEDLWSDVRLPWFTDHTPTHSARLVQFLNQILLPVQGTSYGLTRQECFVLLASCYLHDIGMQDLRCGDRVVDCLTQEDFERIRKEHAQRTYDLIFAGTLRRNGRDSVDLRIEGDVKWSRALMRVCKAHSTPYFKEVVTLFGDDPLTIQNTSFRGEFLCALLLMADELDLTSERIDLSDAKLITLSAESKLHWYTHYYIEKSDIEDQRIIVEFRMPSDMLAHADILKDRVKVKLDAQLALCNPVFSQATGGRLQLTLAELECRRDNEGMADGMPDDVLQVLTRSKATAQEESSLPVEEFRPRQPSPLFTGRKDELDMLAGLVARHPVSMIAGIGGTGKTELVAKFTSEQQGYPQERIHWFDIGEQHTADDMAVALGHKDMLKGEGTSHRQKGVNLSCVIEDLRALVVIDNTQDIADETLQEMIRHSTERMGESRIILVGKSRPDFVRQLEPKLAVKEIGGLGDSGPAYANKLREQWELSIGDDQLAQMCIELDNHPLAIEVALQLLSYGETPDNLIHKIVEFSHTSHSKDDLSKRLLGELYEHASPAERSLAYRLSVFRKPVPRAATAYVASNGNWQSAFNALFEKLMLRVQGGSVSMHPLVSAFCREQLKDKAAATHAGAAEYYKSLRSSTPDIAIEAEVVHHLLECGNSEEAAGLLAEHGESFLLWGHTSALLVMLSEIEKHYGLGEKMLLLRGQLYDVLSNYDMAWADFSACANSDERELKAEAIYRMGYVQFTRGNAREAKPLFEASRALADEVVSMRLRAYLAHASAMVAEQEGRLSDALDLLQKSYDTLSDLPDARPEDLAAAIGSIGNVLYDQGKYPEALAKQEASLKIAKEIGSRQGVANSMGNIGRVLHSQGKYPEALAKYEEGLKICEEIGDRQSIAAIVGNIGKVLHAQDKYPEAMKKYEEGLKISDEIGDRQSIAAILSNIGKVLHAQEKYPEAMEKYEEGLKIFEQIGNRQGIAASLGCIGKVLDAQRKYPEALAKHEASLMIDEEIGNRQGIAASRSCIGGVLYDQGRYSTAVIQEERAVDLFREMGSLDALARALTSVAHTYVRTDDTVSAVRSCLEADALWRRLRHEPGVAQAREFASFLRKAIGFQQFRRLVEEAVPDLPDDLREHSGYEEYIEHNTDPQSAPRVGRNDPCPCGSGKKFKRCCLDKDAA